MSDSADLAAILKALSGLKESLANVGKLPYTQGQPVTIINGGRTLQQMGLSALSPYMSAALGTGVANLVTQGVSNYIGNDPLKQYNVYGMTDEGFFNSLQMQIRGQQAHTYAKHLVRTFVPTGLSAASPFLKAVGIDPTHQQQFTTALQQAGKAMSIAHVRSGNTGYNYQLSSQNFQRKLAQVGADMYSSDAQTRAQNTYGNLNRAGVAQLATHMARSGMLTPDSFAGSYDDTGVQNSINESFKKIRSFAQALRPLSDIMGNDIPKMLQTLEAVGQRSLSSMSVSQAGRLASDLRGTMTVTGTSLQTHMALMAPIAGSLQQYADRYKDLGLQLTASRAASIITPAISLPGGTGDMTKARFEQQATALAAQAMAGQFARDTYSRAYSTYVKKGHKANLEQFNNAVHAYMDKHPTADPRQAVLRVAGVNSTMQLAPKDWYSQEAEQSGLGGQLAVRGAFFQAMENSGVAGLKLWSTAGMTYNKKVQIVAEAINASGDLSEAASRISQKTGVTVTKADIESIGYNMKNTKLANRSGAAIAITANRMRETEKSKKQLAAKQALARAFPIGKLTEFNTIQDWSRSVNKTPEEKERASKAIELAGLQGIFGIDDNNDGRLNIVDSALRTYFDPNDAPALMQGLIKDPQALAVFRQYVDLKKAYAQATSPEQRAQINTRMLKLTNQLGSDSFLTQVTAGYQLAGGLRKDRFRKYLNVQSYGQLRGVKDVSSAFLQQHEKAFLNSDYAKQSKLSADTLKRLHAKYFSKDKVHNRSQFLEAGAALFNAVQTQSEKELPIALRDAAKDRGYTSAKDREFFLKVTALSQQERKNLKNNLKAAEQSEVKNNSKLVAQGKPEEQTQQASTAYRQYLLVERFAPAKNMANTELSTAKTKQQNTNVEILEELKKITKCIGAGNKLSTKES